MGIDTVRMIVSVAAVRTRAFDQVDSAAQVDDFLLLFDFAQQRGFEVDKSHIENKLRFVWLHKLSGRRFERLGTGSGGHEYFDFEISADNAVHKTLQRLYRNV